MPNTEPMSAVETARAVNRIEKGVESALAMLKDMPDWKDIERQENRRDAEQAKQDIAIKAVEINLTALGNKTDDSVRHVHGRINTLLMAVIVSALGTAGSILGALVG